MIELGIDLETTGFPSSSKPLDHEDQPHIVQIGMVLRESGEIVGEYNSLIRCPIDVPDAPYKIHRISKLDTCNYGVPAEMAFLHVNYLLGLAEVVVAHNVTFDMKMLEIFAQRLKGRLDPPLRKFCTMKEWARLKGGKRPKLDDAFAKVDHPDIPIDAPSHHALWDARKALAIYDHLIETEQVERSLKMQGL